MKHFKQRDSNGCALLQASGSVVCIFHIFLSWAVYFHLFFSHCLFGSYLTLVFVVFGLECSPSNCCVNENVTEVFEEGEEETELVPMMRTFLKTEEQALTLLTQIRCHKAPN